jgi:multimeric flavodoxin WrbA
VVGNRATVARRLGQRVLKVRSLALGINSQEPPEAFSALTQGGDAPTFALREGKSSRMRQRTREEVSVKILTLMGSPRHEGNTAAILRMFEERMLSQHEVERVNLSDLDVTGCRACYACRGNTEAHGCVLQDDAIRLLEKTVAADAIVYATPLYMWGVASDLRAFMERHVSLVKGYMTPDYKSLVDGKKAALLVACGGPVDGNADIIQDAFDRFSAYAKLNVVGKYVQPLCTEPNALGDDARALADRMAADMNA